MTNQRNRSASGPAPRATTTGHPIPARLFRNLPILSVVRDPRGRVIDATDWLLERSGKTRRQVIGKAAVKVWPHVAPFLALDIEVLRLGAPIEQLEYSPTSGRWWRARRVVNGGNVVWVGEDATAELKLATLQSGIRTLVEPDRVALPVNARQALLPQLLHAGLSPREAAQTLSMSIEEFMGACVRAVRA